MNGGTEDPQERDLFENLEELHEYSDVLANSKTELQDCFNRWRDNVFTGDLIDSRGVWTTALLVIEACELFAQVLNPQREPFLSVRNAIQKELIKACRAGSMRRLEQAFDRVFRETEITRLFLQSVIAMKDLIEKRLDESNKPGRKAKVYRDELGAELMLILERHGHSCVSSREGLWARVLVAFDRALCDGSEGRFVFSADSISERVFIRARELTRNEAMFEEIRGNDDK